MKNIKNIIWGFSVSLGVLMSCDYLDVVPPEQATVHDTMKDRNNAIGFINSCYMAVQTTTPFPYQTYEWSTDEAVNSPEWNLDGQKSSWNLWSDSYAPSLWDACYNYIGHSHMFLNLLSQYDPAGATTEDKARWKAEAEFLKAYYHFRLLEAYGPIPIVDTRLPQSILPEGFPGRSHFDYVVDYIVNQKLSDETINALPNVGKADDWGRATSVAAMALKGRVLLYAASDLWNGKFPYPDWKNKMYETPGYGKELVSKQKDMTKWDRALEANLKALKAAETIGERKLVDMDNMPSNLINVPLPYIPGVDTSSPEGEEFAKRVLMLRSISSSDENDGNKEIIWGVFLQGEKAWINFAQCPPRILCFNESQNSWVDGWGAINPTLYSVEHFYTKNGKLPDKDQTFPQGDSRLNKAGILVKGHENVIRMNVDREPRFYATFSFDGDDYSSRMVGGKPLTINLLSSKAQGYGWDQNGRNYIVTGYLCKKYIAPEREYSTSDGTDNRKNYAKPLFRLAELYLNVAECYAEKGEVGNALEYMNPIRKRAGLLPLTEQDVTASGMSIIDWVRNERFVELWGEGHRYYDVRRWMLAPRQLKAGAREGLNMLGAGKDPTFEKLNKRVKIDQQFQWSDRMYMMPIKWSEIYNDPQLLQSPEY